MMNLHRMRYVRVRMKTTSDRGHIDDRLDGTK